VVAASRPVPYESTAMIRRLSRPAACAAFLLAAIVLSGCASGPEVDPQSTSALDARHVDAGTYQKVYGARPLDYDDIMDMVRHDVPPHLIVGYLQSTEKVYNFTPAQLSGLKSAGAAPQVINYLEETEGFYGYKPAGQAAANATQQADAYYNDQYQQDEMPFGYNEPIIDDWYDSGYEESLYSPFSMR
jgi:hypothetical protein